MFTLRCTKKLLTRLRVKPELRGPPSTTKLGDWYGWHCVIDEHLRKPSVTEVLGVPVLVEKIDLSDGTLNGRMKDFYDIWLLAQSFEFEGKQLAHAVRATFAARRTEFEPEPIALTPGFSEGADAQKRWAAFLKKSALIDAPRTFAEVVLVIRAFSRPGHGSRRPMSVAAGWPVEVNSYVSAA